MSNWSIVSISNINLIEINNRVEMHLLNIANIIDYRNDGAITIQIVK